jgi:hypothetical protein
MIGKGNDPRHFPLSGREEAKQWEYQSERFEAAEAVLLSSCSR